MQNASKKLIVALDFPTTDEARHAVDELGTAVSIYKIGLELLYSGGSTLAEQLIADGKQVFIDAKLLDIGNTVERAVANIARLGASFLTIHGIDSKTLDAAVKGRGDSNMKLLGVTVMTNLDQSDLQEQGLVMSAKELVVRRALLARSAGIDGVVASGLEASDIREAVGANMLIVTPGIRPAGSNRDDQSRVLTPAKAIEAGADYLVVGRPITKAGDKRRAAEQIIEEIAGAISSSQ